MIKKILAGMIMAVLMMGGNVYAEEEANTEFTWSEEDQKKLADLQELKRLLQMQEQNKNNKETLEQKAQENNDLATEISDLQVEFSERSAIPKLQDLKELWELESTSPLTPEQTERLNELKNLYPIGSTLTPDEINQQLLIFETKYPPSWEAFDETEARVNIENKKRQVEKNEQEIQRLETAISNYEGSGKDSQIENLKASTGVENNPDTPVSEQLQNGINQLQEKQEWHRKAECKESQDCIDTTDFMIHLSQFAPIANENIIRDNATETTNATLGTLIQSLAIRLGVIALLIMTLGAGVMMMYAGNDEILGRGKSIFIGGALSLVIALTSYIMVAIVRWLLFSI